MIRTLNNQTEVVIDSSNYPASEQELLEMGREIFARVAEPFSAVIQFMHQLPENHPLPGEMANKVLKQVLGESMPQLVTILATCLKSIVRQGNVINLENTKPVAEPWQGYVVKKKELVKFEVEQLKEKILLKNVSGLNFAEFAMEGALQKCVVNPPKLECSIKVGPLAIERIVDIL